MQRYLAPSPPGLRGDKQGAQPLCVTVGQEHGRPSLPLNAGSGERLPQPNQRAQGQGKLSQQKGCSPCQTRVHQPTKASLSGGGDFHWVLFAPLTLPNPVILVLRGR